MLYVNRSGCYAFPHEYALFLMPTARSNKASGGTTSMYRLMNPRNSIVPSLNTGSRGPQSSTRCPYIPLAAGPRKPRITHARQSRLSPAAVCATLAIVQCSHFANHLHGCAQVCGVVHNQCSSQFHSRRCRYRIRRLPIIT